MQLKQYTDLKLIHLSDLIKSVQKENVNQLNKWGIQTHSLFEWLTFRLEEKGEMAEAIAECEYRLGSKEQIYNEAIQTATLCLKIAEMVSNDGGGFKNG